jgi:hypothetical protein
MTLGCVVEKEVQRHSFLTPALYVCKSVSGHGSFTHGEGPSRPVGDWLGPTVRTIFGGGINSYLRQDLNPGSSRP